MTADIYRFPLSAEIKQAKFARSQHTSTKGIASENQPPKIEAEEVPNLPPEEIRRLHFEHFLSNYFDCKFQQSNYFCKDSLTNVTPLSKFYYLEGVRALQGVLIDFLSTNQPHLDNIGFFLGVLDATLNKKEDCTH